MIKYCPNCGFEVSGGKFCPECGFRLDEKAADIIQPLDEEVLRTLIVRGKHEEAKKLCEDYIDARPAEPDGYLGLLRVLTNNFELYFSPEIDELIADAEKLFGEEKLNLNADYAAFIAERAQAAEGRDRLRLEDKLAKTKSQKDKSKQLLKHFNAHLTDDGVYFIEGIKSKFEKRVEIPDIPSVIGENAFHKNERIKSVDMCGSVKSIGNRAFYDCVNLESVTFCEGLKAIGDLAFQSCEKLKDVTLPDGVESIGEAAFGNCYRIEKFAFPDGIKAISRRMFRECKGLKEVTIPASVEFIGSFAFGRCGNLKTINFGGTKEQWDAVTKENNWDSSTGGKYTVTFGK
ncbi:MAG: leucine-rich repeat protein [Clostridiales bacterium]|nr:leucine-rich repeat protein [Clostridiales bacterium]